MRYTPGKADNPKRGRGGKRLGAGRKSKQDKAVEARAQEIVEAYIKRYVHGVLGAYLKASLGIKRRKFHPKTGKVYFEIEYDTANQRHWIDKLIPDAAKRVDVSVRTVEDYLDDVFNESNETENLK